MFAGLNQLWHSPNKPMCVWGPETQLGVTTALTPELSWCFMSGAGISAQMESGGYLLLSGLWGDQSPYPIPQIHQFSVSPWLWQTLELGGQTVSAPGEVAQVALNGTGSHCPPSSAHGSHKVAFKRSWAATIHFLPVWHQGRPHQGEPPHASAWPCCQSSHQPENTWIQPARERKWGLLRDTVGYWGTLCWKHTVGSHLRDEWLCQSTNSKEQQQKKLRIGEQL